MYIRLHNADIAPPSPFVYSAPPVAPHGPFLVAKLPALCPSSCFRPSPRPQLPLSSPMLTFIPAVSVHFINSCSIASLASPNMGRIRRIQMRNHSQPRTTTARHNFICCGHLQPTMPEGRGARLRKIRNLITFPENHAQMRNSAPIRP
jgi:hypothetical protein